MIKTKAPKPRGLVRADALKSYVERVEKLEEERGAIGSDIRDVYSEAKGSGYDVKTMRWMVQERKIDSCDRDERDALRDTYAHALGMAVDFVRVEGLSQREAAKRAGVSKSSLNRALAVPEVSQPAGSNKAPQIVPEAWAFVAASRDAAETVWAAEAVRIAAEKEAERERKRAEHQALIARNAAVNDDDLDIPLYLLRT